MEEREESSEDILEYLSKLDKLFSNRSQLYDHFYSGDQDTFIESYDLVVNDKYKLGDYYTHSIEQREYNAQFYKNEIDVEFRNLVSFGKEIIKRIDLVRNNIKNIQDFEMYYMTLNERRSYTISKIIDQ